MSLLLPLDDNGNPIAILGFERHGTQKVAVSADSIRIPSPIGEQIEVITLIATGPCRFEVGDASVAADIDASPFLFPGQYLDVPLKRDQRYVALIAEGSPCAAYVIGRI